MILPFGYTIRLSWTHHDQAEIGSERGIVGIDRIERCIGCGRELDYFGAHAFQFAAHCVMLRLCSFEVRLMVETQVVPARDTLGLIPSGGAG